MSLNLKNIDGITDSKLKSGVFLKTHTQRGKNIRLRYWFCLEKPQ